VIPPENDSSNILERIKQFAQEFETKVFPDLGKEFSGRSTKTRLRVTSWIRMDGIVAAA
jgi:hypothetical protein